MIGPIVVVVTVCIGSGAFQPDGCGLGVFHPSRMIGLIVGRPFQPDDYGPGVFHPSRMIGLIVCWHSNLKVEGLGYSNQMVDWAHSMLFIVVCVWLCVYGYFGGTH